MVFALILGLGIGFVALSAGLELPTSKSADVGDQPAPASAAHETKANSNKDNANLTDAPKKKKRISKMDRMLAKMEEDVKRNPNNRKLAIVYGAVLVKQNKLEKAQQFYQSYLEDHPDDAEALYGLGWALEQSKQWSDAIAAYEKSTKIRPKHIPARNNLAWVLATSPDETIRDGSRAVKIAKEVSADSRRSHPFLADTLAAAYAEADDFESAIKTQELALKNAPRSERKELEERLELYKNGQSYRSD